MRLAVVVTAFALSSIAATAGAVEGGETHNLAGKQHHLTVPSGWSTYEKNGGVGFTPPMEKLHGAFECRLDAVQGEVKDVTAKSKKLAADEQTAHQTWATVTDGNPFKIGEAPAAITFLSGQPPQGAFQLSMFVVWTANGLTYQFVADGPSEDMDALSGEMSAIVYGVSYGKNAPAQTLKTNKVNLDDPQFGITLQGLDPSWTISIGKEKGPGQKVPVGIWMIESPGKPAVAIKVRRFWIDKSFKNGFGKKPTIKKVQSTDLYVTEAVDKKAKTTTRTYSIVRADHAVQIEASALTAELAEADKKVLPVFFDALTLTTPPALPHAQRKGVELTIANGVKIALPEPWALLEVAAAGAIFQYASKEAGSITVFTRARRGGGVVDPFTAESNGFHKSCEDPKGNKGKVDEKDVSFKNAEEAKRYRCRNGKSGSVMILARGKGDDPVHLMVVAYYDSGSSETPDGVALDFTTYVKLP